VGNRDQILDQLLLWAEFFRMHDQQLALVALAEMNQQRIGKTCQPILVGQHEALHFLRQNLIRQTQKLFALKIHSPTDFHNPLIDFDVLLLTILFKDSFLLG
jgi:hypothetical protein